MNIAEFRKLIREEVRAVVNEVTGKTVFVLHHTNQGTPESGEIHSIYTTEAAATAAMKKELEDNYEVTVKDNRDEEYMYISKQLLY